MEHWRTENFRKLGKWYQLRLEQDLFGNWLVVRAYGSLNTKFARTLSLEFESLEAAEQYFEKQKHYRLNSRHYTLLE